MKSVARIAAFTLCQAVALALPSPNLEERATVQGFDISHYQANVNFQAAYNSGARFVIIKVLPTAPQPVRLWLTSSPLAGNRRHNVH